MNAKTALAGLVLFLGATNCAAGPGRIIYYPAGCADRLGSPYKQNECMNCVSRPVPGAYYADQADGTRCRAR